MKKIAIILLINIYALSTFGFSLKKFYCCGKLQSVSIVLQENVIAKCSKGDSKSDCCNTKFQHYQVKDNHFTTDYLTTQANHFYDLISYPAYSHIIHSSFPPQTFANTTHAPPLHNGVPTYISNCIYRI